ncbi:pirin family protein [Celerinatantimonas yamalensis]|uniref:Pirin family protein n=1 Tax=Celerinatantimonas yamalensis TaxID=559956 RepID=A0ABW9G2K0_9GAMM
MTQFRDIARLVDGMPTSDGAGVKLTRMIGTQTLSHLDPFLMLDCFESDQPDDYLAGFPSHPHRGFETVTYILNGRMRHKDNHGHEGVIEEGGIQWMTAGHGVIHSEMPEQKEGLLKGFQLWVNLPAKDKMCPPHYQEHSKETIPHEIDEQGNLIRVIAGKTAQGTVGPVQTEATAAGYFDISLVAGAHLIMPMPSERIGFIYTIEGRVKLSKNGQSTAPYQLAELSDGDAIEIISEQPARILLVTGRAIKEPIAWGGPFVMNTRDEVLQAFDDFRANRF